MENNFRDRFYKRNFYYLKMYWVPLTILFVCSSLLLVFKFTRCSIKAVIFSFFTINISEIKDDECSDIDYIASYSITGDFLFNIFLTMEILIFMTLMYRILKFPIKNDKFYLKIEFISIFFVWLITHHFILGIIYFIGGGSTPQYIFLLNSLRCASITLIYGIVTYIRKNISNEDLKNMLKDFDSFLYCHVCFSFFKEFIKTYHEEDYKYLSFWIEYNIYKKQGELLLNENTNKSKSLTIKTRTTNKSVNSSSINNSQDKNLILISEEKVSELKQMADAIYTDYFIPSSVSQINDCLMQISFPVEIIEKLEEAYKNGFLIDNLLDIFDDAFEHINPKLYNLFLHFCRNEEQYKKLERIMFFIDFYEIKRII